MTSVKAIKRFTVRTVLPESISGLSDLAGNLRWSWHLPTQRLFESIDPLLWERSRQDPNAFLGALSRERLEELAADESVVERTRELADNLDTYLHGERWYQSLGESAPGSIAYFSPEYGISAVLPQYSGGLGILAGDHLKEASDLGVPIIAVGLLYQAGYFKQALSRDAWQQESYPVMDPHGLPLTLLKEDDGTPVRVSLALPGGRTLHAAVWRADVGRVPLLLLDSNVPENDEAARLVTDRLYGGGGEHRLQQELLLGMGGVKALRAFARLTGAPAPEVYHTNEGHAGFLGIERVRELTDTGLTWEEALSSGRGSTVFTTHTPVPAGIDRFDAELIRQYFASGELAPGVPLDNILALGAEDYDGGDPTKFNMAVMGLRLAKRANGVAKLHGAVSREMFSGLWRGFDPDEVPITSVTNGVHVPTWIAPRYVDLTRDRFDLDISDGGYWPHIYEVSDQDLWGIRRELREVLVADVRRRLASSWRKRGAADAELGWIDSALDSDVLTIGFARRVPTYKRLTLMLRDPERLKRLLLDPERPVQLVVAGKSHPADEQGKKMIQDLVRFTDDPEVRHRIVFLPNYDMRMARTLFPGVDVWLNNPIRPLEASGTSGMKAAINGSLNLSILDGWWDEMYDGDNGWAIPSAGTNLPENERDDIEAAALYELLETQVAPMFYGQQDATGAGAAGPGARTTGIPRQWLAMVKHTIATLGPKVSAERMLKDYVNDLYWPAALSGRRLDAEDHAGARDFAAWESRVRAGWPAVRIEYVDSSGVGEEPHIGDTLTANATVSLGELAPEDVRVELVHGRTDDSDELTDIAITNLSPTEDLGGGRWHYSGSAPISHSGAFGYTVRVLPHHENLANSAELGLIATA